MAKLSSLSQNIKRMNLQYSTIDALQMVTQKADQKALNIEREALKKLDNVKKDQEGRVEELDKSQEKLKRIADIIIHNKVDLKINNVLLPYPSQDVVERAREIILSALAHQMSWDRIGEMCRYGSREYCNYRLTSYRIQSSDKERRCSCIEDCSVEIGHESHHYEAD